MLKEIGTPLQRLLGFVIMASVCIAIGVYWGKSETRFLEQEVRVYQQYFAQKHHSFDSTQVDIAKLLVALRQGGDDAKIRVAGNALEVRIPNINQIITLSSIYAFSSISESKDSTGTDDDGDE